MDGGPARRLSVERQGRGEDALQQYAEGLRRDPDLTAARLASARLQLALGRAAEPERDMRQLIAALPSSLAAWEILADALAAQGRTSEAIDAYDAAARLAAGESRRAIQRKAAQLRKRRA